MDRIRPSEHGKYIRPFDTKTLLVATNCIGQYEEMSMHFACIDVAIGKFRGPISGGEKKDSEEDVYLFFESNLSCWRSFQNKCVSWSGHYEAFIWSIKSNANPAPLHSIL